MIHLIKILLYSSATLVSINCQQSKTEMGIHQSQSIYFKNKPEPLTEKIKVLNGIDVLLKKKLHFEGGLVSAWPIILPTLGCFCVFTHKIGFTQGFCF